MNSGSLLKIELYDFILANNSIEEKDELEFNKDYNNDYKDHSIND
ncbi:35934_t:CDS:1, partial [Racocetra persica]